MGLRNLERYAIWSDERGGRGYSGTGHGGFADSGYGVKTVELDV
jgi:hypothetical protein